MFLLGLFFTDKWIDNERQQQLAYLNSQFDDESAKAYFAIKKTLEREQERLNSLAEVFEISQEVSQTHFSEFAQVLLAGDKSSKLLAWVELVKEEGLKDFEQQVKKSAEINSDSRFIKINPVVVNGKPQYALIKYVYPEENHQSLIGKNLYAYEAQKQALFLADITQSYIAASPLNSGEITINGENSISIFKTIFSEKGGVKGYAAIFFNANELLFEAKKQARIDSALRLTLLDSNKRKQTLASTWEVYSTDDSLYRSYEYFLPFAGKNWMLTTEVNLKALPDAISYKDNSHNVWMIGSLVSLITSFAFFMFLRFYLKSQEAQKALIEKDQHYGEIINQSSEAYFLWDCSGRILDVNIEACNLLGYSKRTLLQKKVSDFDGSQMPEELDKLCSGWETIKQRIFETTYQTREGRKIEVEVNASRVEMDQSVSIVAFVRDLTERHANTLLTMNNEALQIAIEKSTLELNEQKRNLEMLFEKSADGILIFDGQRFIDCNQAAMKMFAYDSKAALLSAPLENLFPHTLTESTEKPIQIQEMIEISEQLGSSHFEWLSSRIDGERFWTDVVLTKLLYFGRQVTHLALREVSERKRLELEMQSAREEAVNANKVKSEFLAKMSHEIRTPLHGILSYAQMGESKLEQLSKEKIERYFVNIHKSGERLMALLDDLRDLSKVESGMLSYDFKYQNLNTTIQNCIEQQQPLLTEKQIELDCEGHDLMAYYDKERISQVVSNLLVNAIKHTPYNGKIQIKAKPLEKGVIQCCIHDNGTGIDKDELESIFETYKQGKKHSGNNEGSGLGLAISREIIEAHQGSIWAGSRVSEHEPSLSGAMFCFTIPSQKPVDGKI